MASSSSKMQSILEPNWGRASDGLMAGLFVSTCVLTYVCFGIEHFYQENALFEFGQNVLLASGVVAFFIATNRAATQICQSIMWGLTLFCASLLLRELDVRGTQFEPYLEDVFRHRIHYLLLSIFWSGLFLTVFSQFRETWRHAMQWLFSPSGRWLLAGVAFYIAGDMAEKNLFTSDHGLAKMIEESVELLGTLFIFFAAYATLRRQEPVTTSPQTL